jgi:hypothetical protein
VTDLEKLSILAKNIKSGLQNLTNSINAFNQKVIDEIKEKEDDE